MSVSEKRMQGKERRGVSRGPEFTMGEKTMGGGTLPGPRAKNGAQKIRAKVVREVGRKGKKSTGKTLFLVCWVKGGQVKNYLSKATIVGERSKGKLKSNLTKPGNTGVPKAQTLWKG